MDGWMEGRRDGRSSRGARRGGGAGFALMERRRAFVFFCAACFFVKRVVVVGGGGGGGDVVHQLSAAAAAGRPQSAVLSAGDKQQIGFFPSFCPLFSTTRALPNKTRLCRSHALHVECDGAPPLILHVPHFSQQQPAPPHAPDERHCPPFVFFCCAAMWCAALYTHISRVLSAAPRARKKESGGWRRRRAAAACPFLLARASTSGGEPRRRLSPGF